MRGTIVIGIAMAVGFVAGLFLVATGQMLGAAMGAGFGFMVAMMILAFPRDDYPRERDDTFL